MGYRLTRSECASATLSAVTLRNLNLPTTVVFNKNTRISVNGRKKFRNSVRLEKSN